jgi:hypothetical protein
MRTARLALFALLVAAAALAAPRAVSLVPAGASAVGSVRLDLLKASPVRDQILRESDRIAVNGDAGRFLKEAGLDLSRDVDSVTFWMSGSGPDARPVAAFEGRFDPVRLAIATTGRGAVALTQAPYAYYRLPHPGGDPTAVAYVDRSLVLAGSEPGLVAALRALAARSPSAASAALASGMARVDDNAAAWVVVDGARLRQAAGHSAGHGEGATGELAQAFRSVTALVFQASIATDGIDVKASGLSADAETRKNLEDLVRGVLAGWRMSVDEKQPELVSALRAFTVSRDSDSVTVAGKLPLSAFSKK